MITDQNYTHHFRASDLTSPLINQIQVHLDVLPYLNSLDWPQQYQIGRNGSLSSERTELLACLSEIDSAISKTRSSTGHQRLFNTHLDDLTWRCLITSASSIRTHLRQYAADDLEPLNRLIRQQLIKDSHSQPASSITTRNLVDDGLPIMDSLDIQRQQGVQSETGISSAATNADGSAQVVSQSTGDTAGIRGFLAGAYKDALGKALTIVVGTGLSIFLLNLFVILTITCRSSRARRRAEQTRVHDLSTPGMALNGFRQSIKKSTLKKSNLQQSPDSDFINNSIDGLQLTSLIQGKRDGSKNRAKHLKFNLPSVPMDNQSNQDSEFFTPITINNNHGTITCTSESVVSSLTEAHNLNHQQQVFIENQAPVDLGCNQAINSNRDMGAGECDILLRAGPLLDSYYGNFEQTESIHDIYPDTVQQDTYDLQANSSSSNWNQLKITCPQNQNNQYPIQNHHHHHCGLNASPITNQSFSTATTTTTTSNNLNGNRKMQINGTLTQQSANQASYKSKLRQQKHALYLDHSTASPSSSTTLSMTPIQLESLAAINSAQQYQLEPIGLIYQASDLSQVTSFDPTQEHLSCGPQEGFLADNMFLISSPDSALPISDTAEKQRVKYSCNREHVNHDVIDH